MKGSASLLTVMLRVQRAERTSRAMHGGTAIWSVWTWKDEKHKARQQVRDEQAALFVNSFILAGLALNNCLYRILAEDELEFYRPENQEEQQGVSAAAMELRQAG